MKAADSTLAGPRRDAAIQAGAVALVAGLLLLSFAPLFRPTEMHIEGGLNDQVGYVTTARWLAQTGELRSHLIYPSFVDQPRWRLYMPGHYWFLAASCRLFGSGPLTWRLPGMVSFVIASVCLFLIGRRIFDAPTAGVALLLWMLFPPVLSSAFSAMAEGTVAAAALLAFCLFVHLPEGPRPFVAPLLCALPFLVRETGAFVLLPMLLVLLAGKGGRWRAGVALGGSLGLSGALYAWQLASGKASLPLTWILHGRQNYADAVLEESLAHPGLATLVPAVLGNLRENASLLVERVAQGPGRTWEPVYTLLVLLVLFGALVLGLARMGPGSRARSGATAAAYSLGAGLLGALTLFFLLAFHKSHEHVALRHLLLAYPFCLLVVVAWGTGLDGERTRARRPRGVALLFVLALAGGWGACRLARRTTVLSEPSSTHILESFGHDDRTLLVCDPHIGMDYVLKHYPVRWSFVPANDETLRRLARAHEIGTLVLTPKNDQLSDAVLSELGFHLLRWSERGIRVYRRRS